MTGRYPATAVVADFVRAGGGLAVSLGPLVALEVAPLVIAILSLLAILCTFYAIHAWRRQRTRIEMSAEGIVETASGTSIDWRDLSYLSLGYFSVRRDREAGWMELVLRDRERKLRLDSRLDGFAEIAARAAQAAADRSLVLDPSTASNLAALGVACAEPESTLDAGGVAA